MDWMSPDELRRQENADAAWEEAARQMDAEWKAFMKRAILDAFGIAPQPAKATIGADASRELLAQVYGCPVDLVDDVLRVRVP